jgi:hypothetical protein
VRKLLLIGFGVYLLYRLETMKMNLDTLIEKVTNEKTQIDSLVTLTSGLAQQIRDNANDPAKLQQLADAIDANTKEIADGVIANTPQA